MFDRLRPRLTALGERIAAGGGPRARLAWPGSFPAAAQLALAREIATVLGYDWQAGRLDLVVHPFVAGTLGDVRITARIDEADPFYCLSATDARDRPRALRAGAGPRAGLAAGRRLGLDGRARIAVAAGREPDRPRPPPSPSGCSRACEAAFGGIGLGSAEALHRAANRVEPGFIRTEADEVHYNLHIMLRFDLERALLAGDLAVEDLEAAWNERFAADFGRTVPGAAQGVLQDVHWSAGLIGYFPTYALGNVYAGELWAALCRDLPDTQALTRRGELAPVIDWLRARIHRQGSLHEPAEIVARACGHAPREGPLLDYLEAKYTALYAL